MATKKSEATANQQLAYVGPSFKGVSHCTVFLGELPNELLEIQEKCTAFKRLVVEVEGYGQAQDDLNKSDSVIFASYKTACEFLKKGGV